MATEPKKPYSQILVKTVDLPWAYGYNLSLGLIFGLQTVLSQGSVTIYRFGAFRLYGEL